MSELHRSPKPIMRKLAAVLVATLLCSVLFSSDDQREPPSRHQKVYHLQHRLLPRWTFGSEGAFFADAAAGYLKQMRDVAAELIDEDFSKAIVAQTVSDGQAVLLSFPAPVEPPECYFVLVIRAGDSFRYVTLEMTEDILGMGSKSVVGEWTSEGSHRNLGPRKYIDLESFLKEVLEEKKGEPGATDNPDDAQRLREDH